MSHKQQTFGNVEVSELNHKTKRNPKCTEKVSGEKCPNRAILKIKNNLSTRAEYRCKTHSKSWMLEEIDYHES